MNEILVLQKPDLVPAQRPEIEASLAELGQTVNVAGSLEEVGRFETAEILIAPAVEWLPAALDRLPRVRWIHFLSAGVDGVWEMPIDTTRYLMSKSTGVHAATISEYVLGALLYILKGFGTFARQQQRHEWKPSWLEECDGKTLGIVGIGTIGRRLAAHASALGMTVIGTVMEPRDIPHVHAVYGADDLRRALGQSDFVVVLVPLTRRTRGVVDAAAFESMKPTAWLINVARGEVIDQAALVEALRGRRIAGAVLDVFEEEPLPQSSPLWAMDNVLITPHVAGTTQRYMELALEIFKENYRSFVATGDLVTGVSVEKGY